ncbi:MAG: MocR-like transcription factor YczR [Sporichthyaceae bacterium]
MTTRANYGSSDTARLVETLGPWNRSGHGTLPQRLAHALRGAIVAGLVGEAERLPPERELAAALAVSRSTVTAAFDLLRADGLLVSKQGSGTEVRGPGRRAIGGSRMAGHILDVAGIDLAVGAPIDPGHLPPLRVDLADLTAAQAGSGMSPRGLPALREAVAARHTAEGLFTDAAQVHVTSGAHQAIALTLAACAAAGDAVAVEDPNYSGVFDILDRIGARPVPLAADADGVRPSDLDRVLRTVRPAAVYLQTGPHNPTGRVSSQDRVAALGAVLDRYRANVVEDRILGDLAYSGRPAELAAVCRRASVVTVNSLSKVGWGGLRIGWLRAAPPTVERTVHLKLGTDLGAAIPAQLMAVALFPQLDELAARRRASMRQAVDRAIARIAVDLPDWTLARPHGSALLWARLPVVDTRPFVALAARHGVHVAPGSVAQIDRADSPYVRICVDRPDAVVDAGLLRLSQAWAEATEPTLQRVLG